MSFFKNKHVSNIYLHKKDTLTQVSNVGLSQYMFTEYIFHTPPYVDLGMSQYMYTEYILTPIPL